MFKLNCKNVAVTFHLRNNLNRVDYKSYHPFKHFKILTKENSVAENSKLLRSPLMMSRCVSTRIKIQQYESSRKNTLTWKLERLMGWSLIALIPTASAIHSRELEMALSTVLLIHTYLGSQSMCSDYLRSGVVGRVLPIIVRLFIVIVTLTSFMGAYQLIYIDDGLLNVIKKFWSIRGPDYKPPMRLQKVDHN